MSLDISIDAHNWVKPRRFYLGCNHSTVGKTVKIHIPIITILIAGTFAIASHGDGFLDCFTHMRLEC